MSEVFFIGLADKVIRTSKQNRTYERARLKYLLSVEDLKYEKIEILLFTPRKFAEFPEDFILVLLNQRVLYLV